VQNAVLNEGNIRKLYLIFLFLVPVFLPAEPLYSPTWGFALDLPEGYAYVEGNDIDRYSFAGPHGARFDMVVYDNVYSDVGALSYDVKRRLGSRGEIALFEYGEKAAALLELRMGELTGWGLCMELDGEGANGPMSGGAPLLLALSYAPEKANIDVFHLSALDSLIPSEREKHLPGPIMEFTFPRGGRVETAIAGTALKTMIREHDAEAAQTLVEREFALMLHYQSARNWQEAWIRYYRMIYRDSWGRLADAVSPLVKAWNDGVNGRVFAGRALAWIQGFHYERDLSGSDFINLVSALTEGRGDCDSRSMLWALILMRADIPAAMMVSREYSHAMGLAELSGDGARIEAEGIKWLVAETTKKVDIGLISQDMSNAESWLAILFN
jgi:hypothetical protein